MNGVRSIFRRKGYLFTALAAAVLLAASSGTASAQGSVTIGFETTSGTISELAFLNDDSLEDPQLITVTVEGISLTGNSGRVTAIDKSLGTVTITAGKAVYIARVEDGYRTGDRGDGETTGGYLAIGEPISGNMIFRIHPSHFEFSNEVVLAVAQSPDGSGDPNFTDEMVELRLDVGEEAEGVVTPASVTPDIFTLTVEESHDKPVAKFLQPDFTLSEQSERIVELDIVSGNPPVPIPTTIKGRTERHPARQSQGG